jgi:hypothetical protein
MNAGSSRLLEQFRIPPELVGAAGVRRAHDAEVRELLGIHGCDGQDLTGIVFPYRDLRDGRALGYRVRLDAPRDGQKYRSSQGCRVLFFAPAPASYLNDTSIPIAFAEAEKSALALIALAGRHELKLLAIAAGGVWGWKRKVGSALQPDGTHKPVTGPSPSLDWILFKGRKVFIIFDSNVRGRRDLEKARYKFAEELAGRGAQVFIASVPGRNGVNGPDDLIAIAGDEAALEMIDKAGPFAAAPKWQDNRVY